MVVRALCRSVSRASALKLPHNLLNEWINNLYPRCGRDLPYRLHAAFGFHLQAMDRSRNHHRFHKEWCSGGSDRLVLLIKHQPSSNWPWSYRIRLLPHFKQAKRRSNHPIRYQYLQLCGKKIILCGYDQVHWKQFRVRLEWSCEQIFAYTGVLLHQR